MEIKNQTIQYNQIERLNNQKKDFASNQYANVSKESVEVSASEFIKKVDESEKAKEVPPEKIKDIEKVAQQLQDFVASLNKGISFSVDEKSGKDVISVTDTISGELIRQIPSEEVLELAQRISKAAGIFIKDQV